MLTLTIASFSSTSTPPDALPLTTLTVVYCTHLANNNVGLPILIFPKCHAFATSIIDQTEFLKKPTNPPTGKSKYYIYYYCSWYRSVGGVQLEG